jgi:hypothetical protein
LAIGISSGSIHFHKPYLHMFTRIISPTFFLAGLTFTAILFSSCASETIFKSNFDATPIGQSPAHVQPVGTINIDGPAGGVVVITSPVITGGKWVKITRSPGQQSVTGMQCNTSKLIGNGEYNFSSVLYIPEGSGLVTIQFEPFGQPTGTLTNFLHIDFTEDNRVRIDDNDGTKFGNFTRSKAFMVQVTLKINATGPSTAHIALGGDGAAGVADYTLLPAFLNLAHQFGAVRLWMGFPWTGSFDASTIVVTHKTN